MKLLIKAVNASMEEDHTLHMQETGKKYKSMANTK